METILDPKNPEKYIRSVAIEATRLKLLFNCVRVSCKHHRLNNLTKKHNCFHGNTKTKCDLEICPLR